MVADNSNDETKSFVALTAGTEVSHYKIISKIGSGGMGEVYLAEDIELNRKVALKFLPPHLCQDEDCRVRFTREAEAPSGQDRSDLCYDLVGFRWEVIIIIHVFLLRRGGTWSRLCGCRRGKDVRPSNGRCESLRLCLGV